MPNLEWNLTVWNEQHGWEASGDEWSVAWGGARSQWFGTIYPRIHRLLPAVRILEIAPGHGRWTQFLLGHSDEYFGVDIAEKCVQTCVRRFSSSTRTHFFKNDGRSLAMIPDGSIDFVFSYDSLVHVELDVMGEYIWQICQKLTPTGAAFLHHSNAMGESVDAQEVAEGARGASVSASLVKQLIEDCSGRVLIQEEINWIRKSRTDCMTTFVAGNSSNSMPYQLIRNDDFLLEARLVRANQSPYAAI
jgi:2-polyprenyl-3-methyl-5-hydroxy-6-metoxy-1,4-benzoquinol methylase